MPPKKKGGGGSPHDQYFKAIQENGLARSMDTLRWCLRHGGVTVRTEDEDGLTGIQIAAAAGFHNSMEILLEFVRKAGDANDVEVPDEDDRTPLMLAADNGKFECVRLLVNEGKCKLDKKDKEGKTAKEIAVARKHTQIAAFLADPKGWKEAEDDEDEDEEAQRKRKFLAAQRSASAEKAAAAQEEVHRAKVEAAEALDKALASASKPVWEEIEPVLKEKKRALTIKNKPALKLSTGPVDPAVWQLSRLVDLVTLIVSGNALAALPDEVGSLAKLKNLEAAANELVTLPQTLSQLAALQVLDVSRNKLTSIAPISALEGLVAVNGGYNLLTELTLNWEKLEHLQKLEAPSNRIVLLPPGVGALQQLVTLDFTANCIEQVHRRVLSTTEYH